MTPVLVSPTKKPIVGCCVLQPVVWVYSAVFLTFASYGQPVSVEQGLPPAFASPNPGLHWGRFDFHAGLSGSGTYDDNVTGSADRQEDDFIWTVAPYGSVRTEGPNGRSFAASYRPSYLFFMDHTEFNGLNHSGDLEFRWPMNRLTLTLLQNVAVSSMVVRDVANRTTQMSFGTELNAVYEVGYRTSLEGSVHYSRLDFDGGDFFGSQQWAQQLWGDYHFRDSLSAGVGVIASETEVQDQPTQIGVAPSFRVGWTPMRRLSLEATVGFEFLDYGTGASTVGDPIMRLSAQYELQPETRLTLEGHRAQQASALLFGQNYIDTGFSAGITHVLLGRFSLALQAGYSFSEYQSTQSGATSGRSDSYYFVRTSADRSIGGKWSLGIFYERRSNNSSESYNFDQNMVGLHASWGF